MKLKCVRAHYAQRKSLFDPTQVKVPIHGLTIDKVYEVTAVPVSNPDRNGTAIQESDYRFLIFNDSRHWEFYDLELFEPLVCT
jgi:hypothetical protein